MDMVRITGTMNDHHIFKTDIFQEIFMKLTGDSMEPDFRDGQIAWVSRQDTVASGEIGIFYLNGDAYIKKLQDDEQGVYLISLNEKYAPIKVGENDRLDIFGKVVGKSNAGDIPNYKGQSLSESRTRFPLNRSFHL